MFVQKTVEGWGFSCAWGCFVSGYGSRTQAADAFLVHDCTSMRGQ